MNIAGCGLSNVKMIGYAEEDLAKNVIGKTVQVQ